MQTDCFRKQKIHSSEETAMKVKHFPVEYIIPQYSLIKGGEDDQIKVALRRSGLRLKIMEGLQAFTDHFAFLVEYWRTQH